MAEGLDVRPLLLGAAAWAGSWTATSGQQSWWVGAGGGVLALAVVVLIARHRLGPDAARLLGALTLILAVALAGGILRVWSLAGDPLSDLARERAVVEIEAVIQGSPRSFPASATRAEFWVRPATVVAVSGRDENWSSGAPIDLTATGELAGAWRQLPLGTTVRAVVRLSAADPGERVAATARVREPPVVIAPPRGSDAAVQRVRDGLRTASAGLSADVRALVPALVLGDTELMDPDLVARFKVTGLTHLTAVSGANLVLLLGFVRAVAVRCGVRGRWLTGLLAAVVGGFVALCLGEPSVMRAAAMGLVGLVALSSAARGRQGLRSLAVAVLALTLWDPWLARSIGFALSVTASAGLLWWAGRWTDRLARWLPRWMAEAVAVPLSAQLATQPIVTAISGQISLVGVLANALAGPLVGPATVCGFLAAGISLVAIPLAAWFAWLAGWFAQALCWIAAAGEVLPGAALSWPTTPAAIALVGGVCGLIGIVAPAVLARPWAALAAALALVVALVRAPAPPGWPPASWMMVSCDVGQGDATVFRAGPGVGVLVDTGPDPALLRRCLDQLGIRRVPLVVLTHLHADHVSGLPVLADRGVAQVVTSSIRTPTGGAALVDDLVRAGAEPATAVTGSAWTVGEALVEVLDAAELVEPVAAQEGESSAENDASLLVRVTVGGVTTLLAGDAETEGQQRRLRLLGDALAADVLLVPHHGSSRQAPGFLAAVHPEIALISVGAKNDYGHPTKKTLQLVGSLTPNVVRTDEHGSIAALRREGRLEVTGQR